LEALLRIYEGSFTSGASLGKKAIFNTAYWTSSKMMVTYAVCVIKYPEDTHVFPREDEGRPFRRKRTCFRKRGTVLRKAQQLGSRQRWSFPKEAARGEASRRTFRNKFASFGKLHLWREGRPWEKEHALT